MWVALYPSLGQEPSALHSSKSEERREGLGLDGRLDLRRGRRHSKPLDLGREVNGLTIVRRGLRDLGAIVDALRDVASGRGHKPVEHLVGNWSHRLRAVDGLLVGHHVRHLV